MALTPTDGLLTAKKLAREDRSKYNFTNQRFGRVLNKYVGHLPNSVSFGHVMWVNPALESTPPVTKDRRRGYLYATIAAVRKANIAWEQLDDVLTCSYVWGRDINETSLNLYTTNPNIFSSPNEDFWRCAYLAHILGPTAFSVIWSSRNTELDTVYAGLLYAVNNLSRMLPGWPILKLKKEVFVGCAYVFEVAKQGGSLTTEGFGIQPVPPEQDLTQMIALE